jgi:hypothetical protein
MLEQALVCRHQQYRFNGVFVCVCPPSNQTLQSVFETANITAYNAMAGPASCLVFKYKDRYYWADGVRIPGLVQTIPEFGAPLAVDFDAQLHKWASEATARDEPALTRVEQPVASLPGYPRLTFANLIALLTRFDSAFVAANFEDICDVITMFEWQLTDLEMRQALVTLVEHLQQQISLEEAKITDVLPELQRQYQSGFSLKDITNARNKLRSEIASRTQMFTKLLQRLSRVCSKKDIASFGFVAKVAARNNIGKAHVILKQAAIADNVAATSGWILAEALAHISNVTTEFGSLQVQITSPLELLQEAVSGQLAIDLHTELPCLQLGNALDALTAEILPELAKTVTHPLSGDFALFPTNGPTDPTPTMLLPLMDLNVELTCPYTIHWQTYSTSDAGGGKWRMLVQRCLQNLFHTKNELAWRGNYTAGLWFIAKVLTDTIFVLVSHRHTPVTSAEFNETLPQTVRALVVLLASTMVRLIITPYHENTKLIIVFYRRLGKRNHWDIPTCFCVTTVSGPSCRSKVATGRWCDAWHGPCPLPGGT